jgi:hypothetical protein
VPRRLVRRGFLERRPRRRKQPAWIYTILHAERLLRRKKRLYPLHQAISALPDGAMLSAGGGSFLVTAGSLLRWTSAGYETATVEPPPSMLLLTPPSTLRALAAGYRPSLHSSALPPLTLDRPGRRSSIKSEGHP